MKARTKFRKRSFVITVFEQNKSTSQESALKCTRPYSFQTPLKQFFQCSYKGKFVIARVRSFPVKPVMLNFQRSSKDGPRAHACLDLDFCFDLIFVMILI